MRFLRLPALAALLAATLLGCSKKDPSGLDGPVPTPAFTVSVDATSLPAVATFTATGQDAFTFQWDFGDGSPVGMGQKTTHVYTQSGVYRARLIAGGRGGTATTPQQDVTIPDACGNASFGQLAGCAAGGGGSRTWTFSSQAGAVTRYAANGTTVLSASTTPLDPCIADDRFTFSSGFSYQYDSNGGTSVGGVCGAGANATGSFVLQTSGSTNPRLVLQNKGGFLGLTDSVRNKTYDIVQVSATTLVLRGTLPSGQILQVTLVPYVSAATLTKQLLTGATSRTWMLDNTQPQPITVGTEASPTLYYAGGPAGSLPACQEDDEYTFTATDQFQYDAKLETYVAGSPGVCSAPRSATGSFVYGPVATGSGIGQLTLSRSSLFIGVTDAPDQVYRILSITNTTMLLRAGAGAAGSTVFTIKMKVK
ncbi:MAG: PKD domain-containing protein [Janthinobacterium lividum]